MGDVGGTAGHDGLRAASSATVPSSRTFVRRRNERGEAWARKSAHRPTHRVKAADRLHAALVAGDAAAIRRIAVTLIEKDVPLAAVMREVIFPTLRRIEAAWSAGDSARWGEHQSSAIVERLPGRVQWEAAADVGAPLSGRASPETCTTCRRPRRLPRCGRTTGSLRTSAATFRPRCSWICAEHRVDLAVITVTATYVAPAEERGAGLRSSSAVRAKLSTSWGSRPAQPRASRVRPGGQTPG